jgi:hypothetical protein
VYVFAANLSIAALLVLWNVSSHYHLLYLESFALKNNVMAPAMKYAATLALFLSSVTAIPMVCPVLEIETMELPLVIEH